MTSARTASSTRVLSVSSSVRTAGSRPVRSSVPVTTSTMSPSRSWRVDRFTEIPKRRSGQRRAHSAACRHASSSTQAPISTIRPGLFGRGDEIVGRHETEARAFPTHEGFEAADGSRLRGDERLAEEPELVAANRLAQVGFERVLGGDPLLHRLVEEGVAVPAVVLGAVHRDVGVGEDRLRGRGLVVARAQRDPDARAQMRALGRRSGTAPSARR